MKTSLLISCLLLFLLMLNATNQPVVSNISAAQRNDGSHILDVYYDVYDADGDLLTITLYVSDDEGASWDFPCTMLTGDFGADVLQGVNKHITWALGTEHPDFSDTLFFKVLADDGYTPFMPNELVYVPGGTFTMGRTNGTGNANEVPTHSVSVNSFYIGKYEISQGSYQTLMGINPAAGYGVGDNYPVYNVSWYSAIKYCNLRSIAEGFTPVYSIYNTTDPVDWGTVPTTNNDDWDAAICNFSANGYRLPTEAEWEYAARGATNSPDYVYSGSPDVATVAWYVSNASNTSHSIGTKAANGLGIHDLSGNVMEWCWDWYLANYYASSPSNYPTGPSSGTSRVARGGFFYTSASYCRVAFRDYLEPEDNHYGFRVCRSIATAKPEFSPGAGIYTSPQTITINCATEGATIRYTIDGSEPDASSPVYTEPFMIATTTTLKVRAFKDTLFVSEIAVAEYEVISVPEGFVLVPGGNFTMGRTTGTGQTNELPTHSVTLNSFYLSKFEVTQGEYQTIMGNNPATGVGVGLNFPVYSVSWYSAIKYCNLISMAEGLTPVYTISGSTDPTTWGAVPTSSNNPVWDSAICDWDANGFRLPTEAEWEYAAREATNTPDYLYSGSDDINNVSWYSLNSGNSTHVVGTKNTNRLGIYDLSGNVTEWCWDWYLNTYYNSSPSMNPLGPSSGLYRIQRGGNYYGHESFSRVATRTFFSPSGAYTYFGFRVCRTKTD